MTTPKPIDQLTPEELRMECAEAMGWKITQLSVNSPDDDVSITPPGLELNPWRDVNVELPNYPADANAALTLAHALAEKGWSFSSDRWIGKNLDGHWRAEFWIRGTQQHHLATATGPHAFALALCRAYLAVVRAGKEQQG